MSRPIRHVSEFGSSCQPAVSSPSAWAQSPDPATRHAPKRRPFAKAGTPRHTERIRFFDVKHIKAELTIDTAKREVRGMVTHTLSPLHPYLTQVELDCGPELKVTKVTVGDRSDPCKFATKDGKLSVTLDKAYGPATRSTWRSSTPARPSTGSISSCPRPPIPKSRSRSGPRASPRIRTTGSPATTTPTSVPPAR